MDPSSSEGLVLLAMHFIAQSDPDIRCKIQKATAGPQSPMNDLLQLEYLVFNNGIDPKGSMQRNMQKTQMIAMLLSTQRPPIKGLPSGPGRPQGPWVPIQGQCILCGQKGHWRKDCNWCVLCKQPGHWQKECPRCQEAMGAPQPFTVLQSKEDWCGLTLTVALPRDIIYITYVEPQTIIDMTGHLREFVIGTGATFSVLIQRIANFSNHKEYVIGLSERNRGIVFWSPFCAMLMVSFYICFCLCLIVPSL